MTNKTVIFFLFLLFVTPLINAEGIRIVGTSLITSGNETGIVENITSTGCSSSQKLLGFNTSTYEPYCDTDQTGAGNYNYNQSLATLSMWNFMWNSTFNATYDIWAYNQTIASDYDYNQSLATQSMWNALWSITYNVTYDGLIQWGYNQTAPALTYVDDVVTANSNTWNSSYNVTYESTFNSTYDHFIQDPNFTRRNNSEVITGDWNISLAQWYFTTGQSDHPTMFDHTRVTGTTLLNDTEIQGDFLVGSNLEVFFASHILFVGPGVINIGSESQRANTFYGNNFNGTGYCYSSYLYTDYDANIGNDVDIGGALTIDENITIQEDGNILTIPYNDSADIYYGGSFGGIHLPNVNAEVPAFSATSLTTGLIFDFVNNNAEIERNDGEQHFFGLAGAAEGDYRAEGDIYVGYDGSGSFYASSGNVGITNTSGLWLCSQPNGVRCDNWVEIDIEDGIITSIG